VEDGRLERIHPEIFFLGDAFYIERLTDVTDIGRIILQQGKVGEGEAIEFFL
jgi:hypothetical protein